MTFTPQCPQTLRSPVSRSGVGLHSGDRVTVTLRPAPVGMGRRFVRVDLPDRPAIPATVSAVSQTQLSTELVAVGDRAEPAGSAARVRTVEHLLAALAVANFSDVTIEIDGGEVPLLDGSARDWCAAIASVGARRSLAAASGDAETPTAIETPLSIQQGDASVTALPSPEWRFSYGINFQEAAIGQQWQSWSPAIPDDRDPADPSANSSGDRLVTLHDFAAEIGAARTFGLGRQIESLQAAGLIRGGSLENALVCDGERWRNPPLRFANEPVRHKILDLVGDLSLLGAIPRAHYVAYKASHALHVELARAIADRGR